uniref:Uncharacterized protein n=1 Tax=Neogobius melanostomus TaxID=47308 RepID=A0A8C6WMI6_9GOBI
MMSLMEELKSAQQLLTQPCPAPPDGGARGRWKNLKLKYRAALEETENLLRTQLLRIQEINERRERISQLLQRTQIQGRQQGALQDSLLKAQDALRQSEAQLELLRAEAQVTADHMVDWEQIRDDLQMEVSLVQSVMNMKLLSLSPTELSLELSLGSHPGPDAHPGPTHPGPDVDPLRLTVKWSPDDTFTLQVAEDACGLLDCVSGPRADLRSVLLELLQRYRGQAELLTEIQALRSSFAIDWRPSQHHLVFLKSASEVYELQVEEGYPRGGSVRLLTLQRDGQQVAPSENTFQDEEKKLTLTQWLLRLSSSP